MHLSFNQGEGVVAGILPGGKSLACDCMFLAAIGDHGQAISIDHYLRWERPAIIGRGHSCAIRTGGVKHGQSPFLNAVHLPGLRKGIASFADWSDDIGNKPCAAGLYC